MVWPTEGAEGPEGTEGPAACGHSGLWTGPDAPRGTREDGTVTDFHMGASGDSIPTVPGYRLERLIGRGSTSTVWASVDEHSGTEVAVKVLAPVRYDVSALMALAERETAILARVTHDHIVAMHAARPLADGSVAVVLDLADGGSLADLVRARGRLSAGEVATICTPIAAALAALHEAGVTHGDVTAGNILLDRDGKPMLADFEASRLAGEVHPPTVAGTAGFVAPEVVAGGVPSPASDVFGLGAVAWLALSGSVLRGPDDVRDADRMVGPEFAPVVRALLHPDPAHRPSATDAAVACYSAAPPEPVTLVPVAATVDPAAALTQRLRSSARAVPSPAGAPSVSPDAAPTRHTRREARAARETSAAAHGPAPTARSARRVPEPRQPRSAPTGGMPPWAKISAFVVVAVALVAGLIVTLVRQGPVAIAGPGVTPTVAQPSVASTVPIASDPQTVLAQLAQARATALMSGEPSQLLTAAAPQSAILEHDNALLTSLAAGGQRYADLAYHVRHAEWVRGDDSTAVILAVVDRGVYRLVGPGSASRTIAAEEGRPFVYTLVKTADGWRLSTITE